MWDAADLVLGSLALVLAGAAFAVGGQVVRQAWRDASAALRPAVVLPMDRTRSRHPHLLRGMAAFEAIKRLIR